MIYTFKCDKCGSTKELNIPMNEVKGKIVECICGNKMHQDWKINVNIPDFMKADSDDDITNLNERMQARPSGRDKVYY